MQPKVQPNFAQPLTEYPLESVDRSPPIPGHQVSVGPQSHPDRRVPEKRGNDEWRLALVDERAGEVVARVVKATSR